MNLLPSYEIWKWIPEYEGRYEISNRGRVRSWIKLGGIKGRSLTIPLIRQAHPNKFRYLQVSIGSIESGNRKQIRIHREVGLAFVPNPENKAEVNHLNGDKSCNEWWNFGWATRLENIEHAFINKLIVPALGEQQSNTKLTNEQVLEIFKSSLKKVKLGKLYNVSTCTIFDIKCGRTWWHITGALRHFKPSDRKKF